MGLWLPRTTQRDATTSCVNYAHPLATGLAAYVRRHYDDVTNSHATTSGLSHANGDEMVRVFANNTLAFPDRYMRSKGISYLTGPHPMTWLIRYRAQTYFGNALIEQFIAATNYGCRYIIANTGVLTCTERYTGGSCVFNAVPALPNGEMWRTLVITAGGVGIGSDIRAYTNGGVQLTQSSSSNGTPTDWPTSGAVTWRVGQLIATFEQVIYWGRELSDAECRTMASEPYLLLTR